jgi:hypothetical protein
MPWGKRTALAALTAAVLAGCGSSDDKSIPPDTSGQLITQLHQVQDQVTSGNCELAQVGATQFKANVDDLPSSVDSQTSDDLTKLADNLVELTNSQCNTGASGVAGATTTSTSTESSSSTESSTEAPTTTSTTTTSTTEQEQPTTPSGGGSEGNQANPGGNVIQGGSSGSGGIKP